MDINQSQNLFIQILQDNITRMNQNSMQCKTWCVALVTGIFAVVATTDITELLFLGLAITLGAYILDASYLRLEKNFRCFEKRLIIELKKETVDDNVINNYLFDFDKYKLKTDKTTFFKREKIDGAEQVFANCQNWRDALFSWSTLPVYGVILIVIIVMNFVLRAPIIECCCCCCCY